MTSRQFEACVRASVTYDDCNAYIEDMSAAPMWEGGLTDETIADLEQIWTATHRTIKDIAREAGVSVRRLAFRYAIPRRTAEDWSTGLRTPPPHELILIQQCEGIFTVVRD